MKIKLRRGEQSKLPQLDDYELVFTTDTKRLYIGTPNGLVDFNCSEEILNAIQEAIEVMRKETSNLSEQIEEQIKLSAEQDLQVLEEAKLYNEQLAQDFQELLPTLVSRMELEQSVGEILNKSPIKIHKHPQYATASSLGKVTSNLKKISSDTAKEFAKQGKEIKGVKTSLSTLEKDLGTIDRTEKANLKHKHKIEDVIGLPDALSNVGGSITVTEQDGTPSIAGVTTIKFNNGTITDEGGGVVRVVNEGGGSGDMVKATYDPTNINASAFNQDNMLDGTTNKNYTAAEQTKLSGIATGAEVNVNADWNAVSGDAQILNKPTVPTALSQLSDDSTHRLVTDAEKTTWNAKQSALTNPVTGTGTINEISYWTGTTTQGTLPVATYPSLTELSYVKGVTSSIQTQLDSKLATSTAASTYQPLDSDLTSIAGISPTNDDIIQRKSGSWTNRSMSQLKTDLSLTKSDVGLSNVDNTSNATERAATRTLTNARVTPRTGTTTSSATPTINTDNVDYYDITAQTVDITSFTTNLSGTPTLGQKLIIAIKGTGARAITWGASFEASTVPLPTTTVSTNRLIVGFIWTGSVWTCVATC